MLHPFIGVAGHAIADVLPTLLKSRGWVTDRLLFGRRRPFQLLEHLCLRLEHPAREHALMTVIPTVDMVVVTAVCVEAAAVGPC